MCVCARMRIAFRLCAFRQQQNIKSMQMRQTESKICKKKKKTPAIFKYEQNGSKNDRKKMCLKF